MPRPMLLFSPWPPSPPPPQNHPSLPQWSAPAPSFYPITVGRGVSLAFHLFRFGWRTFVAINLVAYLPVALVTAGVSYVTYGPMSDWQQEFASSSIGTYSDASQALATFPWSGLVMTVVASLLVGVFALVGQAALVDAMTAALNGRPLNARRSLGAAAARLPSLIAIYLVLAIVGILLAGLSLAVPLLVVLPSLGITGGPMVFLGLVVFVAVIAATVFVTIRFSFALQALIVERLPAVQALRRSLYLLGGSMLRLIGWSLVFGLIVGLIGVVVSLAGLVVSLIVAPPKLTSLTATFPATAVLIQTAPRQPLRSRVRAGDHDRFDLPLPRNPVAPRRGGAGAGPADQRVTGLDSAASWQDPDTRTPSFGRRMPATPVGHVEPIVPSPPATERRKPVRTPSVRTTPSHAPAVRARRARAIAAGRGSPRQ